MKLIIVLKKQDAEGYGGDILETMGMTRQPREPGVFALSMPVHDPGVYGSGDSSWSQPEAKTQVFVEALMDAGIRPMRVFQWHDAAAGLTPLHASTWIDAEEEDNVNENDLIEVEDAMAAVGLGPIPGDEEPSDSIHAALLRVQQSAAKLRKTVEAKTSEDKVLAARQKQKAEAKSLLKAFGAKERRGILLVPKTAPDHLARLDMIHNNMNKMGWKSRKSSPGVASFSKGPVQATIQSLTQKFGAALKKKYNFFIKLEINETKLAGAAEINSGTSLGLEQAPELVLQLLKSIKLSPTDYIEGIHGKIVVSDVPGQTGVHGKSIRLGADRIKKMLRIPGLRWISMGDGDVSVGF